MREHGRRLKNSRAWIYRLGDLIGVKGRIMYNCISVNISIYVTKI